MDNNKQQNKRTILDEVTTFLVHHTCNSVVEYLINISNNGNVEAGVGFAVRSLEDFDSIFTEAIDIIMVDNGKKIVVSSIPVISKSEDELNSLCRTIAESVNAGIHYMISEVGDVKSEIRSVNKHKKEKKDCKIVDFTGAVKH